MSSGTTPPPSSLTSDQLGQLACELPLEQRIQLLRRLIDSLPEESLSAEWLAEIEYRAETFSEHSDDYATWFADWRQRLANPHS